MPNTTFPRLGAALTLAVLALAGGGPDASAQGADSVTVVAGPHYEAGGLKSRLLGRDYRDLWTTPVGVAVLDLASYAGGLTPVQRGGGKQTISLRFRAPDGREFNFRSVDKDQTGGLHPDFQETFVDRVAQDQVHSKHPAAGLITNVILDAVGVPHPEPQLYAMPDDPRLGEFRQEFAGMLGTLEIHADEGEDGRPGFAGARAIVNTETLLDTLEESPDDRVDSRAFLKARLVDLLVGDWDRHVGQWRWAGFDRDAARVWIPIPEDRDNAFSDYDGLLLGFLRSRATNLVTFGESYPNLFGLTANAQPLDRPLLSDLPAAVFDSLALEVQRRVTDEVITRALAQGPPEYRALRGAELESKLRARREALPEITRRFYGFLSKEVEILATDADEVAEVERHEDGSVEVRLYDARGGSRAPRPYYQRRFVPEETREVRVYLRGGDDRAVVRGDAPASVLVRVIGGGGDDLLADSSAVRSGRGRAAFYDDRGENEFVTTGRTVVDERPFLEPDDAVGGFNDNAPPVREWGTEAQWLVPSFAWSYNAGPVLGLGPVFTRYGFRRVPFARQLSLRALWAPLETRFGAEARWHVQKTNSRSHLTVDARATQLQVTRFHGFGNETPAGESSEPFKIWATDLVLEPVYHQGVGRRLEIFGGPLATYLDPELPAGGPAVTERPTGTRPYGLLGAQLGALLDTRDLVTFPRGGVRAQLRGTVFPELSHVGAFSAIEGAASAYFPVPLPLESTVAVRAGGRAVGGDFPVQQAAFVGGPGTLRGFARQRFAGDRALWGGGELRTFLTRVNFISRGDLGIIALADVGRVFVDGEASDRWHSSAGGGFWVGILERTRTFSIVYARGEQGAVYFEFGMPF